MTELIIAVKHSNIRKDLKETIIDILKKYDAYQKSVEELK